LTRPTLLTSIEVVALAAWLALAGLVTTQGSSSQVVQAIDPEALTLQASRERWMGIFFHEQQVGFAVQRTTLISGGGTLYEGRSQFQVATFGKRQQITTAGTALVNSSGVLERFDFLMLADQVRLVARGEVHADEIVMEIDQAGEPSVIRFPVKDPPQVGMSIEGIIRQQEMAVGHRFSAPYFDPLTLAQGEMFFRVTDVEVLPSGEEAYWMEASFGEVITRTLVTTAGETLRQEGSLGMSMVRMTPEAAQVISEGDPVDLIGASAVPLDRRIDEPRSKRRLALRFSGVDADRIPHLPPLQTVEGDRVEIHIPISLELPPMPLTSDIPDQWLETEPPIPGRDGLPPVWLESSPALDLYTSLEPEYLKATPTLPVTHPEIRDRAEEVVGTATTRLEAVQKLVDFVYSYVAKEPSVGVPNGLQVLRSARGDCNEHTALFVSLARASGIPTRIAAGLVYSNRMGPQGAFYYHAWPEVALGGSTNWVPVDPTFGQVPADATHLKLVEGDLDRQVEILGVVGRLRLKGAPLQ